MKQYIKFYILGCVFIFLITLFHGFEKLSNYFYDNLIVFNLKNQTVSEDIVIIGVDTKTIGYFGDMGNWTRGIYAGLLENISAQKPKVIAFDYFFSHKSIPDNFDWDTFQDITLFSTENIDMMYRVYQDKIYDQNYISPIDNYFGESIKKTGNVVLPYSYKTDTQGILLPEYDIFPLDSIAKNAALGYVNISPGSDGVIRYREQNINNSDSFPLVIAEKYMGSDISLPEKYYINYFSRPYQNYTAISFHNAYNDLFYDYNGNKIDLKDKIVLIGEYHESLGDTYKTPVSKDALSPGIEIIANEVQSIIQNRGILSVSPHVQIVFLLCIYTFLFFILFYTKKVSFIIVQSIVYLFASFIFVFELFKKDIYFDLKNIIFTLLICYFIVFGLKIYKIYREKQKIKSAFSRYMDKKIVENILNNEQNTSTQKMVSILFLDIEGFTDMSEKIPPKELLKTTNKIFSTFNDIILKNNGTIDKYIGDSIMVFWDEDHASNHAFLACKTAIELQKSLKKINGFLSKKINIRIGINSGEVIIGSIGDENFSDYTILGDDVNLASRLEGINKYYATKIILSENTYLQVKNDFKIRELDNIKVKGKEKGIKIYELFHTEKNLGDHFFSQHQKALNFYYQKKFDVALKIFEKNYSIYQDEVSKIFIQRIHQYKKDPSSYNTDMIFEFHSK